ncbi:right-handed parallel beta-helix repeat-containing protein [Gallaecimonas kandeliae]|uniref:right-handed parallel beta-helix repeat-containing protein n=1 Tax=Gallaecimonas kandeliae TaxID=3029055 RepID=UPI0026495CD9|nr:right-handed parallel beta-helix repeat-containing protein [Gallaecimonas kandeliae]WKE66617.1 right-handed parallel beta-helix repeat-containing protein [Gallaecimonas kandeliae]
MMERVKKYIGYLTLGFLLCLINIEVSAETFTSNTTIAAGEHSYTDDLIVPSGITLTIESGAILRFDSGRKLQIDAGGYLIIQGTEQAPVLFTSSTASPGSWQGITVNGERSDGGDIQISYATIEYANYGVYFSQGAKADITHSVIRNNNVGLYYYGARTGGTVHSSQLYNNQSGVYIYGGYNYLADHPKPVITGNSIYDNSAYNYRVVFYRDTNKTVLDATGNWWGTTDLAVITGKIYDMVDDANSPSVDFSGLLASENGAPVAGTVLTKAIVVDTIWSATDGIIAQPIKVMSGSTLTIAAGTRFNAEGNSNLSVEAGGKLIIQGTEQAPVLFTSSTASPGSWQGITVNGERSDGGDIQISYATIEYANYGVYFSQGAKADITHSVIRNNNVGLYYYGARTGGTVHSSQLYNNQSGVYIYGGYNYLADHPKPVITGNSIYDNSAYNYRVVFYRDTNKTVLDATGNWWGTTDLAVITGKIYDMVDDANSPSVDFSGLLASENGAPVAGTVLTKAIVVDTIWSATDGIIAQPIKVMSGSTLTIAAGTRFNAGEQ